MNDHTIEIRHLYPSTIHLSFGEEGAVGKLFLRDRRLHFEGNVDKSAQTFFEYVCKIFNQDADQEKRDREIRNKALEEAAELADEREKICFDAVTKIMAGELYGGSNMARATESSSALEARLIASRIRALKETS